MPFFNKKKTVRTSRIIMPLKKQSYIPKRSKKGIQLFKKKEHHGNRQKQSLSPVFKILFLFLIFGAIIYAAVLMVEKMRNNDPLANYETQYVIGLNNIPTYPFSQFIFQKTLEEPSVANFISNGNSAYRLPLNKTVDDAYLFYSEELPLLNWQHVLSVPVGSEEMKSGEYWVKDNEALRIYSKFNDIWYEMITVEEAYNGLSERVKKEVERDLLLANKELQDLLPDFPWILKIPKEYVISYRSANYKDNRTVELKKLGSEEKITLTPITANNGSPLDTYLDNYIKLLNKDSKQNWGIAKTVLTYTEYGRALKGDINSGEERHEVAVLINPKDNLVYVLDCNITGNPFFEFVLANLKPQDSFKY